MVKCVNITTTSVIGCCGTVTRVHVINGLLKCSRLRTCNGLLRDNGSLSRKFLTAFRAVCALNNGYG